MLLFGLPVLFMLPMLNLFPNPIIIADRYLHVATAALGLGLAVLATRWRPDNPALQAPRIRWTAGLATLLAFGSIAWSYQASWRSSEALWTAGVECSPDAWITNMNLGHAYEKRGEIERALPYFQRTVELAPAHLDARLNLGAALLKVGRVDDAEQQYRQARRINEVEQKPDAEAALQNGLGLCLSERAAPRGESSSWNSELLQRSVEHQRRAVDLAPGEPLYAYHLGTALRHLTRCEEAVSIYRQALSLEQRQKDVLRAGAYFGLGECLMTLERREEAMRAYLDGLRLAPGNPALEQGLARARRTPSE
jgi:tetratricopeptide (TPR) repeat protein